MSNLHPQPACGPLEGFVQPSLGCHCSKSILHILETCPYFDKLVFDISDTGGPQCYFITSVTIAVKI